MALSVVNEKGQRFVIERGVVREDKEEKKQVESKKKKKTKTNASQSQ